MAREKKPAHKVVMTEGKRNIIQQLFQEYDIQSAEDIQEALKDLLGGTIKEMMEAEMDEHLGYQKSQRSDSDDYRNGYIIVPLPLFAYRNAPLHTWITCPLTWRPILLARNRQAYA